MKILLLSLFFIFFSNEVGANSISSKSSFTQFINALNVENVNFVMQKKIPNVSRIFESKGKIKFVRNQGFIWQQITPRAFTFISTTKEFCTDQRNEKLANLPHFSDISRLIEDTLSGDYSSLNSTFNLEYTELGDVWTLKLIPKINELSELFAEFIIKGTKKQINTMDIKYTDGITVVFTFLLSEDSIVDEIHC